MPRKNPSPSPRDHSATRETGDALRSLAGELASMASAVDDNARREAEAVAKSGEELTLARADPSDLLERLVSRVIAEVRKRDQPVVEKLLYDKRSAAYALSVSVRTIENMLANKQLSYRRCGRKVLIPAADIRRISKLEHLQGWPPPVKPTSQA